MEKEENERQNLAEILLDKRKSTFESSLLSICEEIEKITNLNSFDSEENSFSLFKKIERVIHIYITSEREHFISYLLTNLCDYD